MFTGIIEEVGVVSEIRKGERSSKILIKANRVVKGSNTGDSISTNGVCLTVTKINSTSFEADIMAETIRTSNLHELSKGSKVNLERALSINARLGGHIVTGHIDGVGVIRNLKKEDNAIWITISSSNEIIKYIVYKGSITVDGISLTVAYVDEEVFKVSIIPHTGKETVLLNKVIGEKVNIECDLIGKYVEKLLGFNMKNDIKKKSLIDEGFLRSNGFL